MLLIAACSEDPIVDPNRERSSRIYVTCEVESSRNWPGWDLDNTARISARLSYLTYLVDMALDDEPDMAISGALVQISVGSDTTILEEQQNENGDYVGTIPFHTDATYSMLIVTPEGDSLRAQSTTVAPLEFAALEPYDTVEVLLDSIADINDLFYGDLSSQPLVIDAVPGQAQAMQLPFDPLDVVRSYPGVTVPNISNRFPGPYLWGRGYLDDDQIFISVFSTDPTYPEHTFIDTMWLHFELPPDTQDMRTQWAQNDEGQLNLAETETNVTGGYGYFHVYRYGYSFPLIARVRPSGN